MKKFLIFFLVIYIILITEIHIETDKFNFHWNGLFYYIINFLKN